MKVLLVVAILTLSLNAQQSDPVHTSAVPRLVNLSGKATDAQGKAVSGVVGVTFAIYKEQTSGSPLWLETQSVPADAKGNYSAQLGATKPQGLPMDVFSSGEARWLGVQINGQAEQPRVLLLSVPYALKAADAETIGGLPPSAFVLAAPPIAASSGASTATSTTSMPTVASPAAAVTGTGTANFVPLWTGASTLANSILFQSGTGATAKIGINTNTPVSPLDVKGASTMRGTVTLPATATATAAAGKSSQGVNLIANSFNSSSSSGVNQIFRWQAEAVGNNTPGASGSLNLLFGQGAAAPMETGLRIASNGQITFAPGQTFSGAGAITGVMAGTDLTGGGTSGNITLNLDTNRVPQLIANNFLQGNNTFVGNQTMNAFTDKLAALNVLDGSANGGLGIEAGSHNGSAIFGYSDATTGAIRAIQGQTGSVNGVGVMGNAFATTSSFGTGVLGISQGANGKGVYGQLGNSFSNAGSTYQGVAIGTWGDGGSAAYGVVGTTDHSTAGLFVNNDASDYSLYGANFNASGPSFAAVNFATGKYCIVDAGGNLTCTGTKNAVVPLDGGKRMVAMSAIESPKNWFEDAGSAELVHGVAVVELDPDFVQTVNTGMDYKVFPVPNGDCKGLYITNKTATSFEVREMGGGTSTIAFDYRVMALRSKYENVRFADHTRDMDPGKLVERLKNREGAAK